MGEVGQAGSSIPTRPSPVAESSRLTRGRITRRVLEVCRAVIHDSAAMQVFDAGGHLSRGAERSSGTDEITQSMDFRNRSKFGHPSFPDRASHLVAWGSPDCRAAMARLATLHRWPISPPDVPARATSRSCAARAHTALHRKLMLIRNPIELTGADDIMLVDIMEKNK
ncbi:hypothetical protein E2C01_004146 [Portunus trituberculatus]|uniref:Uncharacterized protein n=1 Tax=Portunus trituberculatus TaxID=210409 RepID=A0A5B7CPU5_PORTR|nr:hypothetical protein [Portunus trituberculatus]